jgi:hypothetical protein
MCIKPLPVQLEMPMSISHLLPNKPAIHLSIHRLIPKLAQALQLSEPVPGSSIRSTSILYECADTRGPVPFCVQISDDVLG